MSQNRLLSIVIATHNRAPLLAEGLRALCRQHFEADGFEVLVSADSCTDETPEVVASFAKRAPFRLQLVTSTARNPSATRNLGAAHAEGGTLLFIDDDLVATPSLVRAHAELSGPDVVVVGYAKPKLPENPCLVQLNAARWWEDRFREMRKPGYRFSYLDCFSCNISMPTSLFRELGGFDPAFTAPGLEDYELGVRLIEAGARFCHAPNAAGDHYEITDLPIRARRIWIEGKATVQLCRRHPQLRSRLLWNATEPPDRTQRAVRTFALACRKRCDFMERLIVYYADLLERLRLRHQYRKAMALLYEFNFWRGVSVEVGGRRELAAWMQDSEATPAVACDAPAIDIATPPSPPVLEDLLRQARSSGGRITLKGVELLSIAAEYGVEPLRWEHLARAVNDLARRRFLPAIALDLIASRGGALF